MIARTFALLLAAALVAGCRSNQQTALMENELRWVEDQYYQLEGVLQQKCKELESCRLENQALRQQLAESDRTARPRTSLGNDSLRRPAEISRPSSRRTQEGAGDTTLPIAPPTVEGLPDLGSAPPSVLNKPSASSNDAAAPLAPDPASTYPSTDASPPDAFELPGAETMRDPQSRHAPLIDTNVTQVVLNRQLTGGYDFDGHAGDEGILIVAEPRNSAGQFVPLAGGLDVSLRDPNAKPGEEEIAVWHLDARQAQAKVKQSLLGRGVHLELPWPGAPPQREDLTLEVSYTTVDGRTIKSERDIRIDPPRQLSARWTPALPDLHEQPMPPREASTIRKAASLEAVSDESPQWQPFR